MKVQRLKIHSFRGIEDLTLEFDPQVNVLIGINGVGKSSILECFAKLFAYFEALLNFAIDDSSKESDLERRRKLRNGWLIAMQRVNASQFFTGMDINNKSKELYAEVQISLKSKDVIWSINKTRKNISLQDRSNLDRLEEIVFKIYDQWQRNFYQENLPLLVYYSVNRAVFDFSLEIPESHQLTQIDAYNQALDQGQVRFKDFFQWFRALEDLENEERRDISEYRDRNLEAVRRAVPQFLDGFSNLRVRRSPLRMTVEKQEQELVINQLSDGEKCLLAMVGDIARRLAIANPGLEDPLQGEGVVLIDEIELHLHPQWQRKIIPALTATFPNCQFIVTTHSPQVISHVEPESIYILEATSEGIKAFRPDYSLGRDSNTILEDLMGVPSRPVQYQEKLHELFRLIEEGNLDTAREKAAELSAEIGSDEAELVGARAAIRRKEILGR